MLKKIIFVMLVALFTAGLSLFNPAFANDSEVISDRISGAATGCTISAFTATKGSVYTVWAHAIGGNWNQYTAKFIATYPTTGGWKHKKIMQRTSPTSDVIATSVVFYLEDYSYIPVGGTLKVKVTITDSSGKVTCSGTTTIN